MLNDRRPLEFGTSDYDDPRYRTIADKHRLDPRPRYTDQQSQSLWHNTTGQEAIWKEQDPRYLTRIDERDSGHGYRATRRVYDDDGYRTKERVGNHLDRRESRYKDQDTYRYSEGVSEHSRSDRYPDRDLRKVNTVRFQDKDPRPTNDRQHENRPSYVDRFKARQYYHKEYESHTDEKRANTHRDPLESVGRSDHPRNVPIEDIDIEEYHRVPGSFSDRRGYRDSEFSSERYGNFDRDRNAISERSERHRRNVNEISNRYYHQNKDAIETPRRRDRRKNGENVIARSEGRNRSPLEYRRETGGNRTWSETRGHTRRREDRNRSPRETGDNSAWNEHRNRSQAEYHNRTVENTVHSEVRNKAQVEYRQEVRSDRGRTRSPEEHRALIEQRSQGRRTVTSPNQLAPRYRDAVEDTEPQVPADNESLGHRVRVESRNQHHRVPAESGSQIPDSGKSVGRRTQKSYRSEDSKRSTQEDELRSLSTTPRMSHEDLGRIVSPPAPDPEFKSRQTQLLEQQMTQADETLKMIMVDADAVRRELETEQERNKTLLAQLDGIEEDKKDLNVKLATMRVKLGVANANLNVNKSESDQMRKKYQEAQIQKARLEERIKSSSADLDRLKDPDNPESNVNLKKVVLNERKQIRRLRTELEGIKSERSELQKQIEVKLQKLKQLEVDIAFVNEQLIISQDDFRDAMTSAESESLERQTIEEKYSELLKEKSEFDQEMETLNEQLQRCTRETMNIQKLTEQHKQKEQTLLEKIVTGEKKLRECQAEVETHKNRNMPQRTASSIKYHQYRMIRTSVVSDTTPHVTVKTDPKGSIQSSGFLGKAIISTKPVTTSLPFRTNPGVPGKQPPKGRGGSLPPKK